MIEPLDDNEISAAVAKAGWVLNGPLSAKAFHELAKELSNALWRKNNSSNRFVEVGHE